MGSRTQPNDARSDEPTARPPRPLPDASLTRSRPRTAADGVLRRAAKTVRITADIQDRAHRSGWRVRYFEYRPGPSHAAHPGNPGFLTVANAVEVRPLLRQRGDATTLLELAYRTGRRT